MSYHHFWLPLIKLLLLDVAVVTIGYSCTAWMLRVKNPSEGTNPFLLNNGWPSRASAQPSSSCLSSVSSDSGRNRAENIQTSLAKITSFRSVDLPRYKRLRMRQ